MTRPTSSNTSRTSHRLVLVLFAVVAGGVGWWVTARWSARTAVDVEPSWPPLSPPPAAPGWVSPLEDGACPLDHPVKANDNSGIFHVPGGRFYDRTKAERCYARAADAEADGYRAAKA